MPVNRREFIKTAGSAIAGAAVGSAISIGIEEAKKRTAIAHINVNDNFFILKHFWITLLVFIIVITA